MATEVRSLLHLAAWRNLRDVAADDRARQERERTWAREQGRFTRSSEAVHVELAQPVELIRDLLPNDRLRAVFALTATGKRRTSVYGEALGLDADDAANAAAVVKRENDRLDKHLRRDARP
jgi:hypothetical protein